MTQDPNTLGLGDFYIVDSDNVVDPGSEFMEWTRQTAWATSLYEPELLGPPLPMSDLRVSGNRRRVINLASCNYLGFAQHPRVLAEAHAAIDKYGAGSCGTPPLSGRMDIHAALEKELACFLGKESAMLFNGGFMGGVAVLSGMLRRGDVAILDAKAHMCWIEGARMAGAKVQVFRHNSPEHLDEILKAHAGRRRVVVIDGIYSMDGNMADVQALMPICRAHHVPVIIDEAHSMLSVGPDGRGVQAMSGKEMPDLIYGTFSKAFASSGGFVAGSEAIIRYLRYYANGYVFSATMPPSVAASALAALRLAQESDAPRMRLQSNADYLRRRFIERGVNTGVSTSQVIPVIVGSDRRLLYTACRNLREQGLFVAPVDYPSVPESALRFRVSVTSEHTREDLDQAVDMISAALASAVQ